MLRIMRQVMVNNRVFEVKPKLQSFSRSISRQEQLDPARINLMTCCAFQPIANV